MKLAVFVGTRPEIIKMGPIVKEVLRRKNIELLFVHTGQHYDFDMSGVFFRELELPKIDFSLRVGSGSQGIQTARIIVKSEEVLRREKPNALLIEGDTNSALGVALAGSKLRIPIGHIEAGCRSFDKNMPEEINRVLISDVASLNFAPTKTCVKNLMTEGILKEQIYLTGHPLVDVLDAVRNKINSNSITRLGVTAKQYYFATVHREENIEDNVKLENTLLALTELARRRPIVLSLHPHTRRSIKRYGLQRYLDSIVVIDPVSYLKSLSLIQNARIVLTDSGGVQQEAALLSTPCVTLRGTTEWIETVNHRVNFLADSKERITAVTQQLERDYERIRKRFDFTDELFGTPGVSNRILDVLEETYS